MQRAGKWTWQSQPHGSWPLSISPSGNAVLVCIPGHVIASYEMVSAVSGPSELIRSPLGAELMAQEPAPLNAAFCDNDKVAVLGINGHLKIVSAVANAPASCIFQQTYSPGVAHSLLHPPALFVNV